MWESSKIKSFPTNEIQLYRLVSSQSLNYEYKKGHLFWHESVTRMLVNIHRFSFKTVHAKHSAFLLSFWHELYVQFRTGLNFCVINLPLKSVKETAHSSVAL